MSHVISVYLTDDHHRCDRLLAEAERALGDGDRGRAAEAVEAMRDAFLRHFAVEEEILFPALEARSPQAAGPTGVMRMEHAQMRQLLDELDAGAAKADRAACLGIVETLHFAVQQHNAKEEGILYPMADAGLEDQAKEMAERLRAA